MSEVMSTSDERGRVDEELGLCGAVAVRAGVDAVRPDAVAGPDRGQACEDEGDRNPYLAVPEDLDDLCEFHYAMGVDGRELVRGSRE